MQITPYVYCMKQERRHRFVCARCTKYRYCLDLADYEGWLKAHRNKLHWSKIDGRQKQLPVKMEEKKDDEQREDAVADE